MQKLRLLFFSLLLAIPSFAQQNLVPNPGFEDTLGCPQGYPDLDPKCQNWKSFRTTPDYINNCSSVCGYYNQYGYQQPHSGQAYAGVNMYQTTVPDASEHIGVQLSSALLIGTKYYISFYVVAAYNYSLANIACNKIGALVTTYPYIDPTGMFPLPDTCTIHSESIISDTLSWTKISGSFIADSAYEYLILGNFYRDVYLDTINFPYQIASQIAYYYLDDVCISTDSIYAETWTNINYENQNQNELLIFPNPACDFITISLNNNLSGEIILYNVFGEIVFIEKIENLNELKMDLSALPTGIYFLKIIPDTDKIFYSQKIFKS
jgi:hypothetical protein